MERRTTESSRRRGAALLVIALLAPALLVVGPGAPATGALAATEHARACPDGQVPAGPFVDLAGGVHDQAIVCLSWWGLARGVEADRYAPRRTVPRRQVARMLGRLLDASGYEHPQAAPSGRFSDVAGDRELSAMLDGLAAAGVLKGYDDGTFRPGEPVSRAQLASMVVRLARGPLGRDLAREPGRFDDLGGSVHREAIERLAGAGIVRGTAPTTFAPRAPIRRDQLASVLVRLLDLLVAEGAIGLPGEGPCASGPGGALDPAEWHDRCVTLDQIQVLGSHNSYKELPPDELMFLLGLLAPDVAQEIEYEHPALGVQFAEQGVRQIELDVFADPEGGLYAEPFGLEITDLLPEGGLEDLQEPGYKVLHVQDIDFASNCPTLISCLEEVRAWSDANPGHLPLQILIEGKSESIDDLVPDDLPFEVDLVQPLDFTVELLDDLDEEILSVFERERVITPDDVRGDAGSLEAAVLDQGWPTIGEARGKVMFLLDNRGEERDLYRQGREDLQGRVMFTSSTPGQSDAAFVQLHDPVGDQEEIRRVVADGYLVRTRSDTPTVEARSGDTTRRDAALESGAQMVSTDYAWQSPFSDYQVSIPGGDPARCNPVSAPADCRADLLEPDVGTAD